MNNKSFTLLELVVVIIIIGILATLGYNQYALMVEKGRTAEAIARLGTMRQLAYEYYLKNGSLVNVQNGDFGVDDTCTSTDYYEYSINGNSPERVTLYARRCTAGGKSPDAPRWYTFYLVYDPASGRTCWYCYWQGDMSPCFGYPNFPGPAPGC